MLVSNHMLVGGSIALAIHHPLIALPLAFLSHFVLDALPHFGYHRAGYEEIFKNRLTYLAVLFDVVASAILIVTVISASWLVIIAALLAASPDLGWLYRYFYYERAGILPEKSWYTKFHDAIQWAERPWGLAVDVLFFAVVLSFVYHQL